MAAEPQSSERVQAAELIAALCLGTDLGMGFPFEHGIYTTLIAMRLADRLGLGREDARRPITPACSRTPAARPSPRRGGGFRWFADNQLQPGMYGSGREVLSGLLRALPDPGSPVLVRAVQTARRLPRMAREQRPALTATCEVAGMLADEVGAPPPVPGFLAHLTELRRSS